MARGGASAEQEKRDREPLHPERRRPGRTRDHEADAISADRLEEKDPG
ncbi:MAG: hypothetical protein NTY18_07930 [Deltaproteobacteria bacterium]|nr:hypothetical protein [Deltaproteobacteria bacterium]